jgi:two-component system cell cycle response regulator
LGIEEYRYRIVGDVLRIKLKNLPELAYGIYTAAVTLSLGSALYIYFRLSQSIDEIVTNISGPVSDTLALTFYQLTLSAFFIAATMVGGLLVVMPIIQYQSEATKIQEKRADMLAVEASTDSLTSLYNRRYFQEILPEFLKEFRRINKPLGLLILDLDHFKHINDAHGHDVGDVVLKEIARVLLSLTREHDIVARIGGEEFAIIAPFASEAQIFPFAERYCDAVRKLKIEVGNVIITPTVSIGVAISGENLNDERSLIKAADMHLYEAKSQGRDKVCA